MNKDLREDIADILRTGHYNTAETKVVDALYRRLEEERLKAQIEVLDSVSCRYGSFVDTTLGYEVTTKAVSLKDIAKHKAQLQGLGDNHA